MIDSLCPKNARACLYVDPRHHGVEIRRYGFPVLAAFFWQGTSPAETLQELRDICGYTQRLPNAKPPFYGAAAIGIGVEQPVVLQVGYVSGNNLSANVASSSAPE